MAKNVGKNKIYSLPQILSLESTLSVKDMAQFILPMAGKFCFTNTKIFPT